MMNRESNGLSESKNDFIIKLSHEVNINLRIYFLLFYHYYCVIKTMMQNYLKILSYYEMSFDLL